MPSKQKVKQSPKVAEPKKVKSVKKDESSDDSSSDEADNVKVKGKVLAEKGTKSINQPAEIEKDSETSNSSEESSDSSDSSPAKNKTIQIVGKKTGVVVDNKKKSGGCGDVNVNYSNNNSKAEKKGKVLNSKKAEVTKQSSDETSSSEEGIDECESAVKSPANQNKKVKAKANKQNIANAEKVSKIKDMKLKKSVSKNVSSSESSSESSDDAEPVKTSVKLEKVIAKSDKKKAAAPKEESSESDSDDSGDEGTKNVVTKKPVTASKSKVTVSQKEETSSSDDDSEEDDDDDPKAAAVCVNDNISNATSSSEDDSSGDTQVKAALPQKINSSKANIQKTTDKCKATAAKRNSDKSSSEDENDSSSEDEEMAVESSSKSSGKEKMEVDDDDDEDDDSDDDDEEEEASSNAEDDDSDSAKPGQKRKQQNKTNDLSSKKLKIDESLDKGKELFIKGLPADISEKKIIKFFKKLGCALESVRILANKGICFADMSESLDSSEVNSRLNGQSFDGCTLFVELTKKKGDQKGTPSGRGQQNTSESKTLFVGNLAFGTTEESVAEHFPGAVSIRLPVNEEGTSKGFAFVEFANEADASNALEELNNSELGGRQLRLDFCGAKSQNSGGRPRGGGTPRGRGAPRGRGGQNSFSRGDQSTPAKSLIVKNLSYSTTSDSLQSAFNGATGARVLMSREDPSKPRGLGFVDFDSVEDAQKAIKSMQGKTVDGRQISLDFAAPRGSGGDGPPSRGGGRGGFRGGRGGRGGGRGGRGGFNSEAKSKNVGAIQDFRGKKKTFDDSD